MRRLDRVRAGHHEVRAGEGGGHRLKVGQTVVQAFRALDPSVTYQIVRLMPACPRGGPQYLIRCRMRGTQRLVGETEIAAAFP